jgi:hypothetical protein
MNAERDVDGTRDDGRYKASRHGCIIFPVGRRGTVSPDPPVHPGPGDLSCKGSKYEASHAYNRSVERVVRRRRAA